MWSAASTPVRRRRISRVGHVVLLLALVVVPVTAAIESSTTAAGAEFAAEADSRVDAKHPDTNFGSSYLRADQGSTPEESFVRFVVSGVGAVERATFSFRTDSDSAGGVQVYAAASEWSESAVTWNAQPGKGAALGATGAVAEDAWVDVDVSSVVRGAGTYTFAIVPTSDDGLDIDSRETGAAPKLVVRTLQPPTPPAPAPPPPPPPAPAPPPPPSADKEPPTAPGSLVRSAFTETSVTFSWSAATDNVAVVRYELFRNGAPSGSATGTRHTITGLKCGTTDWFGVEAVDAAGNRSSRARVPAATGPCSAPPPAGDKEPPTAPGNLVRSAFTAISVTLSWSAATDNVGIARYELFRNGAGAGSTTGTRHTITGLKCGTTAWFGVEAVDAAGNRSSRARVQAATGSCSVPPPSTDQQPPTTPRNLLRSAFTATSVTVSWSAATDNVGVARYEVFRDGTSAGSTTETRHSFTGLKCGTSYWFGVEALDAAGNRSSRARMPGDTSPCATPPPPPPPPDEYTGNPCVDQAWPAGSALPNRIPNSQGSVINVSTSAQYRSALANVNPGQTIRLAPGRYGAGEAAYSVTRSGTSSAPITIEGSGVGATIIDTSHTVAASWVRIRNFEIDGASRSAPNGLYGSSGSDVELCGLSIHDITLGSLYAQGIITTSSTARWHILNTRIQRAGSMSNSHPYAEHGLYLSGSNFLVANVVLKDNTGFGVQLYSNLQDSILTHITATGSKTKSGLISAGSSAGNRVYNSLAVDNVSNGFERIGSGSLEGSYLMAFGNPAGQLQGLSSCSNCLAADPLLDASSLRPRAGSPAIGHVDSRYTPHFDLSGRTRAARPCAGALEP